MFFLVTTGLAEMNARQVCAVESASSLNPSMTIVVVFVLPARQLWADKNVALSALLRRRVNVLLATLDAMEVMRTVGLQHIATHDVYSMVHTSDVLRLLLTLNLGGVYADLDLVMLKQLNAVIGNDNFVVGARQDSFASCLFGLKRNHALNKRLGS